MSGHLCEVVHIATQRRSPIAGELLGAGFGLCDHRHRRKRHFVPPMNRQLEERKHVRGEDEWAPRELDGSTDAGPTKLSMLNCEVPVPTVAASRAQRELESRHGRAVDCLAHREDPLFDGQAKSRSVEKRPAAPSLHLRKLVPPLRIRSPPSKSRSSASNHNR